MKYTYYSEETDYSFSTENKREALLKQYEFGGKVIDENGRDIVKEYFDIQRVWLYENSIGRPVMERLTYTDLDNNIQLKKGKVLSEEYLNKIEEYLNFGYEIDEYTSGVEAPHNLIRVCDTPEILSKCGFDDKPLFYTQKHLLDAIHPKEEDDPHYHGLSIGLIKQLPELLENPVIVADNPSRDDALLVVLKAIDKEKLPIICSIKPDGKGTYELKSIETNMILTVFGKNNFEKYFEKLLTPEKVVFIDKNRGRELERLTERQLLRYYSNLNPDIIIKQPQCIVNTKENKTDAVEVEEGAVNYGIIL